MRDLYGQLIDGKAGRRGQIREGGDGDFSQRGAPKKIELVALYSGLVEVGQDGKATVAFDIPDYNGRLRLMAVAYDAQNVGWAEAGLVVRDPVIAEISAPRFLAPGDKSNLSLTLQNLDGAAGRYDVAFASSGDVQLAEGASAGVELAQGGTTHLRVALLGQRVGGGEITLSLKGPGGYALDRTIAIPVRPASTPVTETLTMRLMPGEAMTLNQSALDPFLRRRRAARELQHHAEPRRADHPHQPGALSVRLPGADHLAGLSAAWWRATWRSCGRSRTATSRSTRSS